MKGFLKKFCILLLAVMLCLLASCSDDAVCTPCVDSDGDFKCDICSKDIVCVACADADLNEVCDRCGKELVVEADYATVSALAVTTLPSCVEFYTGEAFDPSGMVITATGLDGTEFAVTDYALGVPEKLTPDVKAVFVYYGGRVVTVEITVLEIRLVDVAAARRADVGSKVFVEGYFLGNTSSGFLLRDVGSDAVVEIRGKLLECAPSDRLRFLATVQKDEVERLTYLSYENGNAAPRIISSNNTVTGDFSSGVTGVASWDRMTRVFKESGIKVGTYYKIYADKMYVIKNSDGSVTLHLNSDATDKEATMPDGIRTVNIVSGTAGVSKMLDRLGMQDGSVPGKCFSGTVYAIALGFDEDSFNLTVIDPSWVELGSVMLPEHEALVEVAYAYYYKGNYIHYDQYGTRRNINPSPETATASERLHLDCSSFVNAVYYEAFGENIQDCPTTERSPQTGYLTSYAKENLGKSADVVGYWELSTLDTPEKKAEFIEMVRSTLEVGDVIINRRTSDTGHAIIYVGNGYFLHSTGSSYKYELGNPHAAYDQASDAEVKNGTISKLALSTVLDDEDNGRYILAKNNKTIAILRPIARGLTITDTTAARLTMPSVSIEKTAVAPNRSSVGIGSTLIYTVTIKNKGSNDANVLLTDAVPVGTEYIGGITGILKEGSVLTYSTTVKAGAQVNVTYAVKVTATSGTIVSGGNVNGVPLNEIFNTVSASVTESEALTLASLAETFVSDKRTFQDPLDMAKALYSEALGMSFTNSASAIALIDSLIDSGNKTFISDGENSDILVSGLYGGYDIHGGYFTDNRRTRLVTEGNLSVGDVIVAEFGYTHEGNELTASEVYVYLGSGRFIFADATGGAVSIYELESTSMKNNLLVSLISFDRYVIIRPSQK